MNALGTKGTACTSPRTRTSSLLHRHPAMIFRNIIGDGLPRRAPVFESIGAELPQDQMNLTPQQKKLLVTIVDTWQAYGGAPFIFLQARAGQNSICCTGCTGVPVDAGEVDFFELRSERMITLSRVPVQRLLTGKPTQRGIEASSSFRAPTDSSFAAEFGGAPREESSMPTSIDAGREPRPHIPTAMPEAALDPMDNGPAAKLEEQWANDLETAEGRKITCQGWKRHWTTASRECTNNDLTETAFSQKDTPF